jgi:ABC-type nickel/cobalt efflux system permease component RcnA
MSSSSAWLLVGAVAAVGVLHTVVPDHWVPITLIARQRGWTQAETARTAFKAGVGHVVSTLAIAAVVWLAGVAVAQRFGHWVDTLASVALVGFGLWIAIFAWRDLHGHGGHSHGGHSHGHSHSHDSSHDIAGDGVHGPALQGHTYTASARFIEHRHDPAGHGPGHGHGHGHGAKIKNRTALLLILGSSPMIEGIPAFFAAGKYGAGLVILMSLVFGLTTIATYVLLCVYSVAGLKRVSLGPLERYGEVLSGGFIALVGLVFWIWPVL